jgi:hypothetical protein
LLVVTKDSSGRMPAVAKHAASVVGWSLRAATDRLRARVIVGSAENWDNTALTIDSSRDHRSSSRPVVCGAARGSAGHSTSTSGRRDCQLGRETEHYGRRSRLGWLLNFYKRAA